MRKPLVVGNWKMNGTLTSVAALADGVLAGLPGESVECGVCPAFVHLQAVAAQLRNSRLRLGAQDVSEFGPGAYTGEIAAEMLVELGTHFVIIGHSERRSFFGDTDERVLAKTRRARTAGLTPIICVGETLSERKQGVTEAVVARQLELLLSAPDARELLTPAILAYEPVWAIGTGETATPEQAQAVHRFIRGRVAECDTELAERMRLLYGGSVKPGNAAELFAMPDIDGGLIGGAALKAEDFLAICLAAQQRAASSVT